MSIPWCQRFQGAQGRRQTLEYLVLDLGIILRWLLHFAIVAVLNIVEVFVIVIDGGTDLGLLASLGLGLCLGLGIGLREVVLGRLHGSGALGLSALGARSGGDTGSFLQAGDTVLDGTNCAVCSDPSLILLT